MRGLEIAALGRLGLVSPDKHPQTPDRGISMPNPGTNGGALELHMSLVCLQKITRKNAHWVESRGPEKFG